MKTSAADVLRIDGPEDLDRVLDPGRAFGALDVSSRSGAKPLEPALNAAYFACGCETARWSALTALLVCAALAWFALPETLTGAWRAGWLVAAAIAGFAAAGFAGEQVGRRQARRRLHRLVEQARGLMADRAGAQSL